MNVVSVCDPVFDERPSDYSQCTCRLIGEIPRDSMESEPFQYVGIQSLTSQEELERERIVELIQEQKEKPSRTLNGMTTGEIRLFVEPRCFQEGFNLPRLEHSLDCDIEYASHCLHCGCELNDNIARCPDCKKIRHGFELIEQFTYEWQELSAPDVFGERVMTDVQDPKTGSWIGAFRFLEFYLEDRDAVGDSDGEVDDDEFGDDKYGDDEYGDSVQG